MEDVSASGVTFRAATRDDSRKIAELFRISSDGVTDYVWSVLAPEYPGLTPIEIGATRYAREDSLFSYKNCVIAERGVEVVGMLLTFPVTEEQGGSDEPGDPVLEPYGMEVPGSLYVCSLAVFPGFRGRGLGTRMLALAREQASERGLDSLSLLVFEQNEGAVRLYERNGFRVLDRAAVVPHPLIHHTGDVLLMAAEV